MEAKGQGRRLARARGVLLAVGAAVSVAACAGSGGPAERRAERLAEYERHAGAPVDSFHFWDMKRFEVLGERQLAVWTTIDDAWLLTVRKPCPGLEFASAVGIGSTQRRVSARFDTVNFDGMRCQIETIRPVDGDALQDARLAGAR